MKRSFLAGVAVAFATALASSFLAAPPATAGSSTTIASGAVTKDFSVQGSFRSTDIKRCLIVFLSGTVTANWSEIQMVPSYSNNYSNTTYYSLYSPKLLKPRLAVLVYDKCGSGRKLKKLTQLTFRQSYYATLCTENVSIGLSASTSFSLGLSVTPSCGQVKVAERESFSQKKRSSYAQSNTGTVITWKTVDEVRTSPSAAKDMKVCIDPFVYVDAAVGGNFDNSDVDFKALCLKYPS
jgi:hypothetical protein